MGAGPEYAGTPPGKRWNPRVVDPFVSYAQNFEDVMLWRALKGVAGGFFIDVGAWSPTADSVTQAFTDRGWRGINIEPTEESFGRLLAERPTDVNLNIALGDAPGRGDLFVVVGNRGLSTLDRREADARRRDGYAVERRQITVATLADIWDRHVPANQAVHFLKVDVEGFERQVLEGGDWERHRPWIVLVEATRPNSRTPSFEAWEPILRDARYGFAYTDGLNRFYVSEEHAELLAALTVPPNVFDGFILAREREMQLRAERAQAAAAQAEAKLAAMRSTLSWRITAPIRRLASALRRLRRRMRGAAGPIPRAPRP